MGYFLQLFSDKLRDPSSSLEFSMKPGDLVALNNRRVLHGRTAFDPTKTERLAVLYYSFIEWNNDIFFVTADLNAYIFSSDTL